MDDGTVPREVKRRLPFTWEGKEGSLLVSFADFTCPDDCPEPDGYCTVTGESREETLFGLLRGLDIEGYRVHVIQSRQMAPGLGGYDCLALSGLKKAILRPGGGNWLIGTACKCHGTITALAVSSGGSS